jgi:hypothetical protein
MITSATRDPLAILDEIRLVLSCISPDHIRGFGFDSFEGESFVRLTEAAFDAMVLKAKLHAEKFSYPTHEAWQAQLGGLQLKCIRPVRHAQPQPVDDFHGCVVYP